MKVSEKIAIVFGFLLVLTSCQSPQYIFEYATTYQLSPETNVAENSLTTPPIQSQISYDGVAETSDRHFKFDMEFQNTSTIPVTLDMTSFYLIDDDGRKTNAMVEGDYRVLQSLNISPGTFAKFSVIFRFPNDCVIENLGSFKILWSYTSAGQTFQQASKFLRKMVEYRQVYVRDPYWFPWTWNFHWGYHHHRCK